MTGRCLCSGIKIGRYPIPKIHYVEIALRVEFKPEMKSKILEAGRKLRLELDQVSYEDGSGNTQPMTAEEAEDQVDSVASALPDILEANPLLRELGMEFLGSATNIETTAENARDLPTLDVPMRFPRSRSGA